jgi:hypothetical protein
MDRPPQVRTLLGVRKSGTTALLNSIGQHPEVEAVHGALWEQLVGTQGLLEPFSAKSNKSHRVMKEAFGGTRKEGCTYNPFPRAVGMEYVKPLAIARFPVQVFNSWELVNQRAKREDRRQMGSFQNFQLAMEHFYGLVGDLNRTTSETRCLAYEHLCANPRRVMSRLLSHWGLPWDERVCNWQNPVEELLVSETRVGASRERFQGYLDTGRFDTLLNNQEGFTYTEHDLVIDPYTVQAINEQFGSRYRQLCNESNAFFLKT